MKATTVAAAAVLIGSVAAESAWDPWSSDSTTTSTTSVEDSQTWSAWASTSSSTSSTPATVTSKSTSEDSQTWSEWASSSSSTTSADPQTWSAWQSTISTPAVVTSTASASWSAWDPTETITSTSTHWITVTVYNNGGGQTWSEWSTTPTTGVKTTTVSGTTVVSSTITKTVSSSASSDWSAWSSVPTAAAFVDPATGCQLEISLSYGPPVWYPTPVIATAANTTAWGAWESSTSSTPAKVTSTSSDPATWAAWSSTSSTPAQVTSTSSADPSTWAAWSSTSSTPAQVTSTSSADSASWSAWDSSTSSKPVIPSSTSSADPSTWSAWSQTQGGAFYTASRASGSATGSFSSNFAKSSSGISANGNKFGMTYTPYQANEDCKDQATVSADIAAIAAKGFTSVRVYSTDCNTLEYVGIAARASGIKVILGVFISETGISGAQPQVTAIAAWAQWDLVELIVVGNEAVFNNRCSASDLAVFIGSAKASFKAAGYTGAVSTTDELSVWQNQGSAWCDTVDVVTANLYAFFNPNTKAEDAGDFINRQIQDLAAICPGKEVYVMESGWPSAGACNGVACPSPENQATAIKGIQQAVGAKVVFFSFEDEQWKQPGQFGVEQHWGCGEVFN